jgi:hypothetical protein
MTMNTTQGNRRFPRLAFALALAALALSNAAAGRDSAPPPTYPFAGTCSVDVAYTGKQGHTDITSLDGTCMHREFGIMHYHAIQQSTPVGSPYGRTQPLFITSTATYTTAQGDSLNSAFSGGGQLDLTNGDVQFAGVETFDGGSGRFKSATGFAMDSGRSEEVAGGEHAFFQVAGRIRW